MPWRRKPVTDSGIRLADRLWATQASGYLRVDPQELRTLAGDPACIGNLREMGRELFRVG
jgi:hypothetical protein